MTDRSTTPGRSAARRRATLRGNLWLGVLALPAVAFFLVFSYAPMAGLVVAFKEFDISKGVFSSPWNGLANFRYFFSSGDAGRILLNTLVLNVLFLAATLAAGVTLAIMLNEIRGRYFKRVARNPVGADKYEQLSSYGFPGFALCWRQKLELKIKDITPTEEAWFEWAQDYNKFTVDPYASFVPDVTPVKRQDSQVSAAMTQYGNPLWVGAVDVDKGLDALKKAVDKAGLADLQAELEKQANAYLKRVSERR